MKYALPFLALLIFLLPHQAYAAIAYDSIASGSALSSNTLTVPMTVGSSATVLVVSVLVVATGADVGQPSVTYNGVAMTSQNAQINSVNTRLNIFTLISPSTGTHDIVVTRSGAVDALDLIGTSYSGVGSIGNNTGGVNTGTSITLTTNVSTANSWVVSGASSRTGPHNPTPSTGVTNDRTNGEPYMAAGDAGPLSTGNYNMTWNNALNNENLGVAVEIIAGTPPSSLVSSIAGLVHSFWIY